MKLTSLFNIQIHTLVQDWIILMLVVVIVCFVVRELTRNYSQVDKLWSLMPIAYSWITLASSTSPRLFLMAILVSVWGLRMSYNFARKGGYNLIPWRGEEDYRWKVMRENPLLAGRVRFGLFNLLFISLCQNIIIFLFSSPLLLASIYAGKPINVIDIASGILMLGFIITEGIADNQLFEFHKEKKNAKREDSRFMESVAKGIMTEGLWKYCRHPNYASEQAIWICFYFFGVAAAGEWINITLLGSVLLVLLFAGSTKFTEGISAKKYPQYAVYRKQVPKFIPQFVKKKL